MNRAATRSSTSSYGAAPSSSSRASRWKRLAGAFVFVPPGVKRTAFAAEAGTTVVAFGGTPGEKYEPHGWEFWAPVAHLYEEGKYAELADRLREVVEEHPGYGDLFYNLAGYESLVERTARSSTLVARSNCYPNGRGRSRRTTRTSTRFATSLRSRN